MSEFNVKSRSLQGIARQLAALGSMMFVLFATSEANAKGEHLGRCHMGECSWYRVQQTEAVKSDARGALVKLILLGGSSEDSEGVRRPKITWNKETHTVYVFCSPYLPAVIGEADHGFQVDILNFRDGIPGILETSGVIYRRTCLSGARGLSDEEIAKAFKYRDLDEGIEDKLPTLKKPTDIFAAVRGVPIEE